MPHTSILMAPPGVVLQMASPDFRAEYFPSSLERADYMSTNIRKLYESAF
jgi:hypothetical protein